MFLCQVVRLRSADPQRNLPLTKSFISFSSLVNCLRSREPSTSLTVALSSASTQFSLTTALSLIPCHVPASRTNTRIPNSPTSSATTQPPPPAPITITSVSVFILYPHICLFLIKTH